MHWSSKGWLIFQIKSVEAERTRMLIAFKMLSTELIQNVWILKHEATFNLSVAFVI